MASPQAHEENACPSGVCRRGGCPLLAAVSLPYGLLMQGRRWAYRRGILPSRSAGVPVICVGNITCGGTGKTPMTAWAVERLKAEGRRPAILTRGYKAVAGRSDEAELLRQIAAVPVVVNPDRRAGAAAAVGAGADALVMDDGFQHLRLRRDLDIVLIDATDPFGRGLLPAGLRREPLSALRAAGAVVLTRADQVSPARREELTARLRGLAPRAVLAAAVHQPQAVIDEAGRSLSPAALAGRKVAAFCGIGNPGSFFDALERLGAAVVARRALADHAAYDAATLAELDRQAGAAAADVLVTTQKDFVKLRGLAAPRAVWQLAVGIRFLEGQAELEAALRRACRIAEPAAAGGV